MADITYCAGSDKCAKKSWCRRAILYAHEEQSKVSIAMFHEDYDKVNDVCPHFWDYRE